MSRESRAPNAAADAAPDRCDGDDGLVRDPTHPPATAEQPAIARRPRRGACAVRIAGVGFLGGWRAIDGTSVAWSRKRESKALNNAIAPTASAPRKCGRARKCHGRARASPPPRSGRAAKARVAAAGGRRRRTHSSSSSLAPLKTNRDPSVARRSALKPDAIGPANDTRMSIMLTSLQLVSKLRPPAASACACACAKGAPGPPPGTSSCPDTPVPLDHLLGDVGPAEAAAGAHALPAPTAPSGAAFASMTVRDPGIARANNAAFGAVVLLSFLFPSAKNFSVRVRVCVCVYRGTLYTCGASKKSA